MKDFVRSRADRRAFWVWHIAAAIVAMFSAPSMAQTDAKTPQDWYVRTTTRSVPDVVQRLKTNIKKGGGSIAAVVDHAAGAGTAGMKLPQTTVVIFGNPKLGTPLIAQNRVIAIDLPQRILVWREGATTRVGFTRPSATAARYGISGNDPSVIKMDKALTTLVDAASK